MKLGLRISAAYPKLLHYCLSRRRQKKNVDVVSFRYG